MALDNNRKRGSKKKGIVIAAVLGAAALAALGFFLYRRNEQKKAEEAAMLAMSQPVEEMAVRTSIETVFSAQGSVASSQEMTAGGSSTDKTGAVVAEVYVKVGDTVQQGDPLYRLDMSAVEADIADQEAKLKLQQQSDAIDQNAAGRAITNAQYDSSDYYYNQTRNLGRSADDTNALIAERNKLYEEYQNALQAEYQTQDTYNAAQAYYNNTDGQGENALAWRDDSEVAYNSAVSKRRELEEKLKAKDKELTGEVRSLEDLGAEINAGNRKVLEAEATAKDNQAKQQIDQKIDVITTQSELRKNYEKLEGGVVTAGMSGTVTDVKVTAGKVFSGDNAVTIDDLNQLKIRAEIDESKIADITVGMPVRVKTAATGDEVLEGVVTFTAPVPTKPENVTTTGTTQTNTAQRTSSSKPTYTVEIRLNVPSSRLRIGMTASIEFIVKEARDCIAVPSSCLIDDGMGGYFVQGADGIEKQVQTGISDDYYTQIVSGNIEEGEVILSPAAGGDTASPDLLEGIF